MEDKKLKKFKFLEDYILIGKLSSWNKEIVQMVEEPLVGLFFLPLDKSNKEHVKYSKITSLDFKYE